MHRFFFALLFLTSAVWANPPYPDTLLQTQRALLKHEPKTVTVEPLPTGRTQCIAEPELLPLSAKMGCIILAGGQGSRLGYDGPKGCMSITPLTHKSLFQLFCEKTLAASRHAGEPLSIAIMTSPINHEETLAFLKKHRYFGLSPEQVDLFKQDMLPLLNDEGAWFFETPNTLALAPNGHGNTFEAFYKSPIWKKWKKKGITYINLIHIDNVLADPFDPVLLDQHEKLGYDLIIKGLKREDPDESVGILAIKNGKLGVCEYSEVDDQVRYAKQEDGSLQYPLAYIGLFSCTLDFIKKVVTHPSFEMPLHAARKKAGKLEEYDDHWETKMAPVWKFETFIFDAFCLADNYHILVSKRAHCFAPLKNKTGRDSLETVQAALSSFERHLYTKATGNPPPEDPFELDPKFYYSNPKTAVK